MTTQPFFCLLYTCYSLAVFNMKRSSLTCITNVSEIHVLRYITNPLTFSLFASLLRNRVKFSGNSLCHQRTREGAPRAQFFYTAIFLYLAWPIMCLLCRLFFWVSSVAQSSSWVTWRPWKKSCVGRRVPISCIARNTLNGPKSLLVGFVGSRVNSMRYYMQCYVKIF